MPESEKSQQFVKDSKAFALIAVVFLLVSILAAKFSFVHEEILAISVMSMIAVVVTGSMSVIKFMQREPTSEKGETALQVVLGAGCYFIFMTVGSLLLYAILVLVLFKILF